MRRTRGDGGGVEDRRGAGGGGGRFPTPSGRTAGVGGLGVVVVLIIAALVGFGVLGGGTGGTDVNVGATLDRLPGTPAPAGRSGLADAPDPDANLKAFVSFVVRDVQESWDRQFTRSGRRYRPTTLVLFTSRVNSGCGAASSDTGPFYCPADQRVYLDLGFFRELRDRFGAPGDFAQAYVIAHEFGHHVQDLLGIDQQVAQEGRRNPGGANQLSVRLELQADCFAGVWAHSAYEEKILEEGDLEEGLTAAAAIGDDRLQQASGGRIDQDSWTHGSSAQRVRWFQRGFDRGEPADCDTFSGDI